MAQACHGLERNSDGSWTSVQATTIDGPEGEVQIAPIMTFFPGEPYVGVDIAAWLEGHCETGGRTG